MTGAGQVCLISSVQESWYTQWELAAPPHQTQPYLGSAVRHLLQSDRPTEQLNRVTGTRERKASVWGNYIILKANNCTTETHTSKKHSINSPHHTDHRHCQWESCFFSWCWSWLGIPPSVQNRHTETRAANNSQSCRSTTCDVEYELMLFTSTCRAVIVCVKWSSYDS